jgi:amino acid transporter
VAIALVLTGMVSYTQLDQSDFLAHSFSQIGLNWFSGILALSAVVATTGVMLVFQLGQPRIWLSMSRDGLLPKRFSTIHPRFKTPSFATWIAFLLVGLPSLVIDAELATDMSSIGTLFAFFLVCAGVLIVQNKNQTIVGQGKFRVPYINGRYVLPPILLIIGLIIFLYDNQFYQMIFSLETYSKLYSGSIWQALPYIVFAFASLSIVYFTIKKKLSLIPVLGVWSCFYLITEMGFYNWVRFLVWLIIGLIIYFIYSFRKSKLNNTNNYK